MFGIQYGQKVIGIQYGQKVKGKIIMSWKGENIHVVFGQVFSVPMPKENTIYIVSQDVANAVKRPDVYCLGEEIRDKQGYVIGYEGLST